MDIPSWCRVGQKVVAKASYTPPPAYHLAPLVGKQEYTIRNVIAINGAVGIRVVEIRNPAGMTSDAGFAERYYHASMFTPLTDTKFESDIAMFKDIMLHAHEYRDITEHV